MTMRVPHDSLILVADGRKRLFFRNQGDAVSPDLSVIDAAEDKNPRTREQVTDSAGQAPSPLVGGIPVYARADAHQVEEDRFAAETADILGDHADRGDFTGLIVVAPAKTLGELRKHYNLSVKTKLIGEMAKDLTGHHVDEIEAMLVQHGE
ncbi:MAG TPA: host attachment family protein [Sphingomonas sp.]|nr:host attachment family protein [Sphingomonas sp.]